MLDGTDLSSAFQPFGASQTDPYSSLYSSVQEQDVQPAKKEPVMIKKEAINNPPQIDPQSYYDANIMNKQYSTEQRLNNILTEIKKKKEPDTDNHSSYFDRLFGKKKELFKILQLALIITLGLSLYYFIDHYLKAYLQENDLSFERQLFIRLLYPLSLLFILWNLKVFVK